MLPDSGTDLENVEFKDTTTYHWGKFDVNATDNNGFEDAQGPFAFGLATKLNKEKNQVLSHCLEIMKKVSFFMLQFFFRVGDFLKFRAKIFDFFRESSSTYWNDSYEFSREKINNFAVLAWKFKYILE